jgi:hypothetical protein
MMKQVLFFLYTTLFAIGQALADAPADSTERASMGTVLVFLGLFFGGSIVFVWFIWMRSRKNRDDQGAAE